jgi:hypothetical protein
MTESTIITSGHLISECGDYVFKQWKCWDMDKPKVNVIQHHPKQIFDQDKKAVIIRMIRRMKMLGYGGFVITYCNPLMPINGEGILYHMKKATNKYAKAKNETVMEQAHDKCELVLIAVGNGFKGYRFSNEFLFRSDKLNHLGLTGLNMPMTINPWPIELQPMPFDITEWNERHGGSLYA